VYKPRPDFYAKKRPTLKDVLFIVEVPDTTLSYDQKIKLPRYAAAGTTYTVTDLPSGRTLRVIVAVSGRVCLAPPTATVCP